MKAILSVPLTLPCGFVIKNRIAKAAMSESLSTLEGSDPSPELVRLYERFSRSGAGLLITGNAMVSADGIGEYGNVLIRPDSPIEAFRSWSGAATRDGVACFLQLNHAGRQSPKLLNPRPVAPSAVPMKLSHLKMPGIFNDPRELSLEDIQRIIAEFARAGWLARESGFSGIQIHGAHGYLISQFLSPLTNLRQDRWGGNLDGRMNFLIEVYREVRRVCGVSFPISLKLNSADFLQGGFSPDDAIIVAKTLSEEGIDLLEISGGSYENPKMSKDREAHFLDAARLIRKAVQVPLMLTGGFRTPEIMARVIRDSSVDMVGLARAIALEPDFPAQILNGRTAPVRTPVRRFYSGFWNLVLDSGWYQERMQRIARGQSPENGTGVLLVFLRSFLASMKKGKKLRSENIN
jgi:2,4-dienoyl-CoA reductase-like NADH-dependent reductase (Old Yellow Enzyme family)